MPGRFNHALIFCQTRNTDRKAILIIMRSQLNSVEFQSNNLRIGDSEAAILIS